MHSQRDCFSSILVVIEDPHSGQVLSQQILKLTDTSNWTPEMAHQWLQLVERKFRMDGTIDPVRDVILVSCSWARSLTR